MYSIIENNNKFLSLNDPKSREYTKLVAHFKMYVFLVDINNFENNFRKDDGKEVSYKGLYKYFWGMNAARNIASNIKFDEVYFDYLENSKSEPDFKILLKKIEPTMAGFQFSFSTKAIHCLNPELPIYDVNIRRFYFLKDIDENDWEKKLEVAEKYYEFLGKEYKRIIEKELLKETMGKLNKFLENVGINSKAISDIKKIDSIIWAWVNYLNNIALIEKKLVWN